MRWDSVVSVKLFTHTDLDGVSCAVLLKRAFPHVDVVYCNYSEIDEAVMQYITSMEYQNYHFTFITDISVNESVARVLNRVLGQRLKLLDHHKTAEWLNDYVWAFVKVEDFYGKTSGTSMLYLFLQDLGELVGNEETDLFVETVRRYDTWEWHDKYGDLNAKKLNDLLYIIGRERFVERFTNDIVPVFNDMENMLLELEDEKISDYVNGKLKSVSLIEFDGYSVAVVFAERCISQLGNVIASDPRVDFAVVVNMPNSVSFRTVRDGVNLSEIAKRFGGGGHVKAAGAPLNGLVLNTFVLPVLRSG